MKEIGKENMLNYFYPDAYMASTYVIPFEKLKENGIKGVIFDIDNTLVPHGEPADDRAKQLFKDLEEMGLSCCLISNNKEERVKMFNEEIGVESISKAWKPSRKNYRKAMEIMGTDIDTTVFIGDQLFTDILGAKRTGIKSILVKPLKQKEEIQIVLKRYLENIVLRSYKRQKRVEKSKDLI